jgi:hypothetical protein
MQLSDSNFNFIVSIHKLKLSLYFDNDDDDDDDNTEFEETCHLYLWLCRTIDKLAHLTNDNYFEFRDAKTKEYKTHIVYENCRIATEIYYLLNTYWPDIIEADAFNMLNTKRNSIKFHEKMYEIFDDISDSIKERHQTDEQKHILKMLIYELTKFDTETIPRNYRFKRHNSYDDDKLIGNMIDFDMLDVYSLVR